MRKELGQRTDAELEALFGDMYPGWERGLVITQERFGNGETRFAERPMTRLELAARYVAAEIGINIYEIANRAAFAPITTFSQIQARIGPTFEALEAENEKLRSQLENATLVLKSLRDDPAVPVWIRTLSKGTLLAVSDEISTGHAVGNEFPNGETDELRKCQKCGTPTNGEEALVDGKIWCHPCADAAT